MEFCLITALFSPNIENTSWCQQAHLHQKQLELRTMTKEFLNQGFQKNLCMCILFVSESLPEPKIYVSVSKTHTSMCARLKSNTILLKSMFTGITQYLRMWSKRMKPQNNSSTVRVQLRTRTSAWGRYKYGPTSTNKSLLPRTLWRWPVSFNGRSQPSCRLYR